MQHLYGLMTDNRKATFEDVLSKRTRHITVAIENIFQSQNASAVLRTCDCFGIQDVHVIENSNTYEINSDVALGSSKWVNINRYDAEENNTVQCINTLKEKGYKIIGTTPHTDDITIDQLDITDPTALIFGTEKDGLSDLAKEHCDGFVKIPMYGFTESFNISVSAALCLHTLSEKMRASEVKWNLSEEEIDELRLAWSKNTIQRWETHERDFNNRLSKS